MKEEIWGISIARARDFFREQPDVNGEGDDAFDFRSCRITLSALAPKGQSIWSPNRTSVRMEGPDEDVQTIYHRFFLQFLSAGG